MGALNFVLGVCHGLLVLQAVQAHVYILQLVLRFELLDSRRRHCLSTSASGFATSGTKKSAHFLQTLWHEFCIEGSQRFVAFALAAFGVSAHLTRCAVLGSAPWSTTLQAHETAI